MIRKRIRHHARLDISHRTECCAAECESRNTKWYSLLFPRKYHSLIPSHAARRKIKCGKARVVHFSLSLASLFLGLNNNREIAAARFPRRTNGHFAVDPEIPTGRIAVRARCLRYKNNSDEIHGCCVRDSRAIHARIIRQREVQLARKTENKKKEEKMLSTAALDRRLNARTSGLLFLRLANPSQSRS